MEHQELRSYIPGLEKVAILKAYKCSYCNRIYSTQVHSNTVSGRIPLLMPCSHTICEECLVKMARTKNINCKICQYEMILQNNEAFPNLFPVDRYMFGSLMNLNSDIARRNIFVGDHKSKVLPFTPAGCFLRPKVKKSKKVDQLYGDDPPNKEAKICSQQGCQKRAEFRCINCSELYCSKCNKRVHESIRILRNHTRYPIDIGDLADFNVSCVAHSNSVGEYSCFTCGTMLCSKCVIKDHIGHEVISIEDKNAQELDAFKDTLKKAKHILRCMEFTQKKIKLKISTSRQNIKPSHLESDIIKHFAGIHSQLQLLEQNMLEELSKAQDSKLDSLNRVSNELNSNIAIMHSLVATGNLVAKGSSEHMDKLVLSELENNIIANLMLPCELLEEDSNKEDSVQFITDQSVVDVLQNHCRIVLEEGLSFKLSPMTDFSDKKYDIPTDDYSATSSDTESFRSRNDSESSGTSQISYLMPGCKTRISLAGTTPTLFGEVKKEKPKDPNEPTVFTKDTVEMVTVTHLTNPSLFYVQLCRKKREVEELTKRYERYAAHTNQGIEPEIGNTYIVQYTSSKLTKWYRAVVKDIHTTGLTTLYEVFYIDFGNSSVVPANKIKPMKPVFMQEAPFAHRCRLNGIISQRNEWTDEVLSYMVQFITGNHNLKMHVIQNQKGILDVDLYAHNESLSAALIFVGHAQPMKHIFDGPKKRKSMNAEIEIVSAIQSFKKNKAYPICVTCVINPHEIYVQALKNEQIIRNLQTGLTRYYERRDQRKQIFTPEEGMTCVAILQASKNNWWRVRVLNILGNGSVEVFALDYGITEVIQWERLSLIRDVHKQTDAQAIQVSLSDIAPPKSAANIWPEESIEFLRKYLKDTNLSMHVNETSDIKLMVTIYERLEETDICIDALLVRKELAESTGEKSILVEYHKILPKGNEEISIEKKSITQLINETKPQNSKEQSNSIMRGKNFIVEIKILQINSPSNFYIEVLDWHEEKIKMFKQMAQFYSEQISPSKKWELQEKCVVRSIKDDKYYRAVVTKILDDDCYEVFLKDLVRNEEVPTRNLYELNENFYTHDYSLHCCLGGIKPAGGLEKWSGRSIEVFKEFVENYKRIFITKHGPIVDKMLSVQLVASWEEKAGPLEPFKTETVVLNDILIHSGLGIPVKVDEADKPVIKSTSTPPPLPKLEVHTNRTMSKKQLYGEITSNLTSFSNLPDGESSSITQNNQSSPQKPSSWLQPAKLSEKHFKALPTYVDFDGSIYIQTAKSKRMLKNVSRILEKHFKNSNPDPFHPWDVGQMCTILYHLDKTFCRGIITDVTSEKIVVKLIDFGNQEEVSHEELRSEVLATDIPTLAIKCKLANVVPKTKDGLWSIHVLDRLHITLVGNECEIVLVEEEYALDDIPHVLIYLNDECINNLCNSAEWSKESDVNLKQIDSDDASVVIESELNNSFTNEDVDTDIADISAEDLEQTHEKLFSNNLKSFQYDYIDIPADTNSFAAVVINIIDYRSIVVEADFSVDIMTETREQFDRMSEEINTFGPEQPKLKAPLVGMPCIALFGDDKKWYRAEILDIMNSQATEIKVLFIDYGNVEIVPNEDVRVMKQKWLENSVSMLRFKIWGIQKIPDYDTIEVTAAMKEAIIDKQVICQIKEYTPDIEVKLINEETYELMYKHLIDENIIQNID